MHMCKEHNIAENNMTRTIFELDLYVFFWHIHFFPISIQKVHDQSGQVFFSVF